MAFYFPQYLKNFIENLGTIFTSHLHLPTGTTAQRPATPVNGMIRYNSTTAKIEMYEGGGWVTPVGAEADALVVALAALSGDGYIVQTAEGTVSNRSIEAVADETAVVNGDGVAGNTSVGLAAEPAALAAVLAGAGTGVLTQTAATAYARRSIAGTADQVAVSNGGGVAGNPTVAIADNPIIPGDARINIPSGDNAARPGTPVAADLRFTTEGGANKLEFYNGAAWETVTSA